MVISTCARLEWMVIFLPDWSLAIGLYHCHFISCQKEERETICGHCWPPKPQWTRSHLLPFRCHQGSPLQRPQASRFSQESAAQHGLQPWLQTKKINIQQFNRSQRNRKKLPAKSASAKLNRTTPTGPRRDPPVASFWHCNWNVMEKRKREMDH